MPKYTVVFENVCSFSLEIEADDVASAIEMAEGSEDMPGGITVGAFNASWDNPVDDSEWTPVEVMDAKSVIVWRDGSTLAPE